MSKKSKKLAKREQALAASKKALRQKGKTEDEIAKMEKLARVLYADKQELADASLILAAVAPEEPKALKVGYLSSPKECHQLLYRRLDTKRIDGTEILEPSWCKRDAGHQEKHGLEGVAYLHPVEYPQRV